ncbi:uncharacterized protein LOC119734417 isoform X2 [Patiria miniata]|uniref:Uncharacterized protein n=1 Tax=Patiria miniata TaxID=46514 RepID=A0A914AJP8_PATMI|nr:uncharacterized protein LOC119734417 isoform X2 [Patiria miniata]
MGCIPSAVAVKDKSKVSPAPSPNTLRGDLISRDEARQRRNKGVAEHHAKANKVAQTIAYNTMAEKELMSTTSTERSYRSGRAFLISATASTVAENNGSEQGSSSTVSDGANPFRSEQQGAATRNKNDGIIATSTKLPYAVPEEESPHQLHDLSDAKGHEVKLQNGGVKGQRSSQDVSLVEVSKTSDDRTQECENNGGNNSRSKTDVNIDEHEVKGQETILVSQTSQIDGDELEVEKPTRTVQFAADGTEDMIEIERGNVDEDERTKSTENGSVATAGCLPAG